MRRAVGIAGVVLLVLYPLGIWAGISTGKGRAVGLVVLIALIVLAAAQRGTASGWWPGHLPVVAGLALASLLFDQQRLLLGTPFVINLTLLAVFGASLLPGRRPLVERFARMMDGDLSAERATYCRAVTKVWCGFFLVNGSIALWLAVFGSISAWGLYTGAIGYGLMVLLFAAEYAVRRLRFG